MIIRQVLYFHNWNMRFSVYEMNRKLWGDDIINSFIWIFIRTGQEVFSEKSEISKCHNFPLSYPIFIIFALFCREFFFFLFQNLLNSGVDFIFNWMEMDKNSNVRISFILELLLVAQRAEWEPSHHTELGRSSLLPDLRGCSLRRTCGGWTCIAAPGSSGGRVR